MMMMVVMMLLVEWLNLNWAGKILCLPATSYNCCLYINIDIHMMHIFFFYFSFWQ